MKNLISADLYNIYNLNCKYKYKLIFYKIVFIIHYIYVIIYVMNYLKKRGDYKMGTNYYFKIKEIKVDISLKSNINLKKCIQDKVNDYIEQISEIHIGKRSMGWKPLFQETVHFNSVAQIQQFYEENKDCLIIVDEYGSELTFDELREDLIIWNKDNLNARPHKDDKYYHTDDEGYDFGKGDFE